MGFLKLTCFVLFCIGTVSATVGPFGSDAASEGPCTYPLAYPLLNTNLIWLLNINLSQWYIPWGSTHFFRDIFEHFEGREATSQAELDNWDLALTYLANLETWSLYGKHATDICILVPGSALLGIPIFRCELTVYRSLLGIPIPLRTITQDFTIIWTDNAVNILCYRCQNGQRDWLLFTRGTKNVDPNVLNGEILPKVQTLGFDMSKVKHMSYGQASS